MPTLDSLQSELGRVLSDFGFAPPGTPGAATTQPRVDVIATDRGGLEVQAELPASKSATSTLGGRKPAGAARRAPPRTRGKPSSLPGARNAPTGLLALHRVAVLRRTERHRRGVQERRADREPRAAAAQPAARRQGADPHRRRIGGASADKPDRAPPAARASENGGGASGMMNEGGSGDPGRTGGMMSEGM